MALPWASTKTLTTQSRSSWEMVVQSRKVLVATGKTWVSIKWSQIMFHKHYSETSTLNSLPVTTRRYPSLPVATLLPILHLFAATRLHVMLTSAQKPFTTTVTSSSFSLSLSETVLMAMCEQSGTVRSTRPFTELLTMSHCVKH